ncbi:Ig-like domain-containing protein [Nocardioides conyzicola]|uniref:Bacterial Ig-like domain-containing protein n=1 Tax=Nocardioides conyzicola TaxID=1651781 RepID=A0ABP8XNQ5_9ACTN
MTKTLSSILVGALAATLLVSTPGPSSAAVTTEGFESAVPTGWTVKNNSAPVGTTTVLQGETTAFSAHDGPATSYAAMNYQSVGSGAQPTISTWLITPRYTSLSNGDAWSFFTRKAPETLNYPDRLEVRLSTNGGCSPGAGASSVGDFTTLLLTINPTLTVAVYPTVWTQFQGALSGITGGAKAGCLAFRYYVSDAGVSGHNGDYIGIDTYSFDDQPADTTPPDTTITSGPTGITTDPTPTFAFASTEAGSTFACSLDGAAYGACSGPGASHTSVTLDEGAHTFAVRATDDMANTDPTPATRSFIVDAALPDTTITSGPGGPTNDSTPTFAFNSTEADVTFACSLDEAPYEVCSEPDGHTTSVLADGPHTFTVRATDTAGHVEDPPATRSFTVDTNVPDTSITSGPDGLTNDPTPTWGIASTDEGGTFECSVDQAEFSACDAPEVTLPTLSDGEHGVSVRAIDAAGNVDPTPAVRQLTVDTAAPETMIEAVPAYLPDSTPTFGLTAGDGVSTYECALDGAEFVACAGTDGRFTAPLLADGMHTLAVRATDPAGNTDPEAAQVAFTVDTAAPSTSIASGPPAFTSSTAATFAFTSTETGSTYECSVDGAAYAACSGPGTTHTTTALADGAHSFAVRATDRAGNVGATPSQVVFTVDTAAPDTTIASGPTGDTPSTQPTFTFTATETGSTYECSLDGAAYAACSGPGAAHTTQVLAVGAHTFVVRAIDRAGNADQVPAIRSFTVVSPPPSCSADKASVTKARAAVTKATAALTKATKKLKAAKKAGNRKAIAQAKKKVATATKAVKAAKRTLAVATGRLTACQVG